MYKAPKFQRSSIQHNNTLQGETIEQKVTRIVTNKEPVKEGAPLLYTERKDGVLAGYNIRTDRFEVALEATDKITKSKLAAREKRIAEKETKVIDINGGTESIQGTQTN